MDINLLMYFKEYRFKFYLIFLAVSLFFLQSCSQIESFNKQSDSIIKSANDQRDYYRFKLDNNLDVLLISDPTSDKAAASLDIYMGSYQNPYDRAGLAHFLEHMLFLGTEQYPDPDEYQTFISEHGGSHNASTGLEHTNYFFDIDAKHLEQALDRFAPFFTHPNFDAAYVDRERNAVESEYKLKIKDDGRRQWDILREQIDPKHPLSKFTVGNLHTLADRGQSSVRDELIEMYKNYYSANLMTLVVLGRESIDQLKAMVNSRFSKIVDRQVLIEPYRHPYVQTEKLPLHITYIPLKESREISLLFLLPNLSAHKQSKPARYLANLIGHEGQGSLLHMLKTKGWIEGLSAGTALEDRSGSLFAIDLSVTSEGMAYKDQIITDLFAWLKIIRTQGIDNWRQKELATMGEIEFRYSEKWDPSRYVTSLSRNMHRYKGNELLSGPYQSTQFERKVIQAISAKLVPSNMIVMITDPEAQADNSSQYYQAPYISRAVDSKLIDRWTAADTDLQLHLPKKNPYIPKQLSLVSPQSSSEFPSKIYDQDGLQLWYLESSQFGVPKAKIRVSIGSDLINSLPGKVSAELYAAYIGDLLNTDLYPAILAGLGYSIRVDKRGILIELDGYAENQPLLLKTILSNLVEPNWDQTLFNTAKQQLIRQKANAKRDYPFRQIMAKLRSTLNLRWMPSDEASALEDLTIDQMQLFKQRLLAAIDIEALIVGNHDNNSAAIILKELLAVNTKALHLPRKVAKIPASNHIMNLNIDHKDAVVAQYIQGDQATLEERAKLDLIGHMMSAPFFNQLRTEKQLGYVVSAFSLNTNKVPGICLIVQSPVATESTLRDEFSAFIDNFSKTIDQLTEQDLQRHKEAILVNLLDPAKNLRELSARFAESIRLGFDDFQYRSQLAQAVSAVTISEIRSAYDRILLENPRLVWVQTSSDDSSLIKVSNSNFIEQQYSF